MTILQLCWVELGKIGLVEVRILTQSASKYPGHDSSPVTIGRDWANLPDSAILELVVRARDQEAYTELYRRMEGPSLNLARAITSNRVLAEEAVQEAFLRVWVYGSYFKPGGQVRGWILQIVARESLRKSRSLRKELRDRDRAADAGARHRAPVPASGERQELQALLHRALEHLSQSDLRILALHYGAGLDMSQTARALQISNRKVYRQLGKVLAGLRSRLRESGCESGDSRTIAGLLEAAILAGVAPSPRLAARILAQATARVPSDTGVGLAGAPILWGLALVSAAVIAAAGIAYLAPPQSWTLPPANMDSKPDPKEAAGATKPAGQMDPARPPGLLPSLPVHWDFEQPGSFETQVAQGLWGRMHTLNTGRFGLRPIPEDTLAALLLPARAEARPLLITLKFQVLSPKAAIGVHWCSRDGRLPDITSSLWRIALTPVRISAETTRRLFLVDDRIVYETNGQLEGRTSFGQQYPERRILLYGKTVLIDSIWIQPISREQIPDGYLSDSAMDIELFRETRHEYAYDPNALPRLQLQRF